MNGIYRLGLRRYYSTSSPTKRTRTRLPKSLAKYAEKFKDAPGSYMTSFLLLHEFSAVGLLFGFVSLFHQMDWAPTSMIPDWILEKGNEYFTKLADKQGWKEFQDNSVKGQRLIVQAATAYGLVKLLLPLRIGLCVWATPWFAKRCIQPVFRVTRMFSKVKTMPPPSKKPPLESSKWVKKVK